MNASLDLHSPDSVAVAEETAASMADLLTYQPEPDGECSSEWPEAPDFEPLTADEYAAIVRRAMLLRAERDAIAANSEAMVADLDRQIQRIFDERDAELRYHIDGGYGRKSARCIYGLIGVRKGGGHVYIVDLPRALESARELAPSAIRKVTDGYGNLVQETIDLTKLPPHFTAPGFDVTPETSKLYVQNLPRTIARFPLEDSEDE